MSDPAIGALRRRLTLQRPVRADDGGGGAAVTWETVAEVWAALSPLTGVEALDADRLAGRVSHEIWIRWRADVLPEMRFALGSRLFDIRAAFDTDERRRWLRCLALEKIP